MGLFRRSFTSQGAPPGAIHVAPGGHTPRVQVMAFDASHLEETSYERIDDVPLPTGSGRTTWIDIQGIGDGRGIQELTQRLGVHPLAVSDIVHLGQRPKVDRYDGGLLVVLRMVSRRADGDSNGIESSPELDLTWEQVSVFIGPDWVLSVQETHDDCLGALRDRIRGGRVQIRSGGADYLGTMVVDAIVDGYFPLLEIYGDLLEEYEYMVLGNQAEHPLARIYGIKRDLSALRRAAWPLRDALQALLRRDDSPLSATSALHLRDTLDHVMQVVDVTESFREVSSGLVDVHLSLVGQRTNEVMRVLTVISAVFIPLTFLAGVYGMNFSTSSPTNLPELRWKYGYLFFWGMCLVIGGGLAALFARLGWLRLPSNVNESAGGSR